MAGIEKEAKVKHTYLKSLPSSFSYLEDFLYYQSSTYTPQNNEGTHFWVPSFVNNIFSLHYNISISSLDKPVAPIINSIEVPEDFK